MPNHIHLIVSSKPGFTFSDIIRDFKKFTSGKILKTLEDARIESRKSWMTGLFTSAGKENSRNESTTGLSAYESGEVRLGLGTMALPLLIGLRLHE
jgi:REP element-mobilizing transposase RayT